MKTKSSNSIGKLVSLMVIILVSIIAISVMTCVDNRNILNDDTCQAKSNLAIIIGLLGSLVISLLFFRMERKQNEIKSMINEVLIKYGKAYALRTCLFNLQELFSKETRKLEKDDENRKYFVKMLKDEYIDKFDITDSKINKIYSLVINHPQINESHNPDACNTCKDEGEGLISKIGECILDNPHPIEQPPKPKK